MIAEGTKPEMKGMVRVFTRENHPRSTSKIRYIYELQVAVTCPTCGSKTKRVDDFEGKLYHACLKCFKYW